MNREVSSYLDCARLLAAILVLLAHVELNWVPGVWHFLVPLGNESLAVLFVLSGFVIGYVSNSRETTLKSYLIHRAARVYSVLIPCVIFGLLLDFTGEHFMAHYYISLSFPPLDPKFYEILYGLLSFTFLGEAWGYDYFPGSMAPYWTLPYEVTYYLVFGAAWYLRGWRRLLMLAGVCAIAGPQVLMFFPLWLIGMVTYRLHLLLKLRVVTGRMIFFGTLLVLLVAETIAAYTNFDFGYGDQESPDMWPFYLAGSLFAVLTIGFCFSGFTISRQTAWARWLAGASATLYLLHFPLGRFLNGLVPFDWPRIERWPLIVLPLLGVTLMFAHFTERRKEAWRRKIEIGCDRVQGIFMQRRLAVQKDS